MKKSIAFLSSILLVVLCMSMNVFAQETGGEMQGTVKDPTGAVVPNANITISGVDVGFNRTLQTDNEGFYRVRQIPPGVYRVTVAAISGFAEQIRENVQVALGNATTLDVTLGAAGVGATVDVSAGESGVIVDPTETKAQDNLSARDIETLPKGTGFASLLNRTSQLRSDAISGQFTVNGATGPENSFIIDGQEVQNFRTGVLNTANDIPYQSVQEIQVRTSGFEAEFGGATGGVINVVTKSGTNDFRGEFGLQFASSKLNAGPRAAQSVIAVGNASQQFLEYLPQQRDPGHNFFPTASIGGPIIKDRVWFFGVYSPRYFNATRTSNFVTTAVPGTRTQTASVTSRSKSVQEYAFGRIDASPFNALRVSSSFTWNPYYDQGLFAGGSTIFGTVATDVPLGNRLFSGANYYEQLGGRQNSNNFRTEAIWTPNSNLVSTIRYTRGFLNERLGSYGIANVPRFQCRFTATANQTVAQLEALAGCTNNFQNVTNNNGIIRDVSIRNTVDADASYLVNDFLGRHEFKGGYTYSKITNDVESGYVSNGVIRLCYGRFTGGACLGYPTGITFNSTNAPLGIGQSVRFGANGKASNTAHTIFVQDKWQPTSRLTLNLGVRTEQESLPAFNVGTVQNATNLKFNFKDKLAPRLGAAYALTADGRTKISAFYGRFFDRLKFELPRGSFGGNFFLVDTFAIDPARPAFSNYTIGAITTGIGSRTGGICPVANAPRGTSVCQLDYRLPSNVPGFSALIGPDAPADAGQVDPDLKPFSQTEVTVEFQREVMRSSVFTSRFLYRNLDSAVEDAGFVTSQGSEFYDIANPCEGLHLKHIQQFGFQKCVKAERKYKALQLEYDTRLIRNFNLNVNYTLSRLTGTMSGLANPDEATAGVGRNSPGVNRYFDQPFVGFTASGREDRGILPLDRTHVFKASGTYTFDWLGSKANSTDLSFFTTAQTGTPQTTFVDVFHIAIPLTERGDLGRTPAFTQTDFNLAHRYRFGRDERFAAVFEVNVLNAFNEANVIALNTQYDNVISGGFHLEYEDVAATPVAAVNILTSQGVINRITALNGTPQTKPENFNAAYGQPAIFQGPRTVRFGFRLLF